MKFDTDCAHIVYASDEKFAEVLGVSLVSLFENSQDMNDIHIYVLDSGITIDSKAKLQEICNNYQRTMPTWIPAKDISIELGMQVALDRGSLSQYARLFVSSVLPADLERVLYLDCDIIVNKSIKKLWNLDMKGKTIAALMDAFSKYYRSNIDLNPDDVMFNSGVMLIDLNKWKKHEIEKKLLNFIAKKKGRIQQGDQGALNAVLSKDVYCFEPQFNSVTIFYDFSYEEMLVYRRPPVFYSREAVEKAVNEPELIHFTTSFLSKRPWIEGCQHYYVDEWLKYRKRSPWKNECLWADTSSWKKKFVSSMYKGLPRRLGLYMVAAMQVYVRPLLNRVMSR